jgi:Type I restriction enzyme R protein N terminus (HSDR_N).
MNIDQKYLETLKNLHLTLKSSFDNYIKSNIDIKSLEYSVALINRMKQYYQSQYDNKEFLEKRYITNGADYFTEQLLFFIKVYLKKNNSDLIAISEKQIKPKRGAIRPDISIWKEDKVVAIIECKTQLGWNRHKWESDFNEREKKLHREYKNAKAYLVVLTGENWGGFEENDLLGEKYYCLLKNKWVTHYENDEDIFIPIEKLLSKLI